MGTNVILECGFLSKNAHRTNEHVQPCRDQRCTCEFGLRLGLQCQQLVETNHPRGVQHACFFIIPRAKLASNERGTTTYLSINGSSADLLSRSTSPTVEQVPEACSSTEQRVNEGSSAQDSAPRSPSDVSPVYHEMLASEAPSVLRRHRYSSRVHG
jgi:hypothetical protein